MIPNSMITDPNLAFLEHLDVGIQRGHGRQQQRLAAIDGIGIANGGNQNKVQRIRHSQKDQAAERIGYGEEDAVSEGLVDSDGTFGFHMHVTFPCHNSEVSLSFFTIWFITSRRMILMTVLNRLIAAEKLYCALIRPTLYT